MYPDPAVRKELAKGHALPWILEYTPKILLPGKGMVTWEPWPFQIDFLLCGDRFRGANKPRQCGVSTTAAAEAAWEFDNIPGSVIIIVSKDKDAAVNFHKYIYNILYSVRDNWSEAPELIKTNEKETTNSIGSRIVSLAASQETGRSFSATHWYFDEMAFAKYADKIFRAAAPTIAQTQGRITVISTPNGRANLFGQIFDSPETYGFTTFDWKWWDVPTYNPYFDQLIAASSAAEKEKYIKLAREGAWYKQIRGTYTQQGWEQEFEGSFDADESSVFTYRQLEKTFWKPDWLEEAGDDDSSIICREYWTSPAQDNHAYVTGVDLGRKRDPTVIITYDTTVMPAVMVEFKYIEAGAADFLLIEREIRQTFEKFNKSEMQVDATGSGDAMSEVLEDVAQAFIFTKFSKENIIRTVQLAMDNAAIKMPKIKPLFSEHQKYIWDDKDIRQDTVMANALAVALFYDPEGSGVISGVSNASLMEDSPWLQE